MSNDQLNSERAEFEAWAKPRVFSLVVPDDDPDEYKELETASAWEAWQARAALASSAQAGGVAVPESVDYTPGDWYMAKGADDMQRFFRSRLPSIRDAAREHGYAIGVHGSERRDFDLIAVPWRDGASEPDVLAHAIAKAACGLTRAGAYQWETKPAGRIAVSLPICWTDDRRPSAGHIDLSLLQPAPAPAQPAATAKPEHIPTPDDINAQDWEGMDGATAYQLIERHGEDWSHIGRLMGAWLAANTVRAAMQQKGGAV